MIDEEYKPIIKLLAKIFFVECILFVIFIIVFCEISGGWF